MLKTVSFRLHFGKRSTGQLLKHPSLFPPFYFRDACSSTSNAQLCRRTSSVDVNPTRGHPSWTPRAKSGTACHLQGLTSCPNAYVHLVFLQVLRQKIAVNHFSLVKPCLRILRSVHLFAKVLPVLIRQYRRLFLLIIIRHILCRC